MFLFFGCQTVRTLKYSKGRVRIFEVETETSSSGNLLYNHVLKKKLVTMKYSRSLEASLSDGVRIFSIV